AALLRELVLLDIEYRRRRGEHRSPDDYRGAFPDLDPDLAPTATAPSARAPAPGPMPGEVGGHELLEEIGRGGMGVVFRARHRQLGRVVALKMVRAGQVASPDELHRFRAEAELAATLDHPNIVPLYEVGEHEGQPFYSMKLIDGGSLLRHLDRFRSDPRASAALVAVVARAVQHAHQRGILHRDLKPGNVLLDGEGTPHIADFGLARPLEGEAWLTQSGALVGTPSYMAPEQAAGKTSRLTT